MRAVKLQAVKARLVRPSGGLREGIDDRVGLRRGHLFVVDRVFVIRDGAGGQVGEHGGLGFAARVVDLQGNFGPLAVYHVHQALHALDLGVIPQAQALIGDAAFGRDARGFHDDQANPADGAGCVVRQVEIVHQACTGLRRIHAHGRHDQAVFERHVFKGK